MWSKIIFFKTSCLQWEIWVFLIFHFENFSLCYILPKLEWAITSHVYNKYIYTFMCVSLDLILEKKNIIIWISFACLLPKLGRNNQKKKHKTYRTINKTGQKLICCFNFWSFDTFFNLQTKNTNISIRYNSIFIFNLFSFRIFFKFFMFFFSFVLHLVRSRV